VVAPAAAPAKAVTKKGPKAVKEAPAAATEPSSVDVAAVAAQAASAACKAMAAEMGTVLQSGLEKAGMPFGRKPDHAAFATAGCV
jgi:stage V sporulation protein SpoVS